MGTAEQIECRKEKKDRSKEEQKVTVKVKVVGELIPDYHKKEGLIIMKANMTYTNEFTGEIFSDREDCVKAEKESKADFIKNLIADMELIKDICNSHAYCESCPFNNGDCIVELFTDKYLDIVHNLQGIND